MARAGQEAGLLVVSSCGTSLLTNGADEALRRLLLGAADRRADELAAAERRAIEARLEAARAALRVADEAGAGRAAAELNALLALAGEMPAAARPVRHLLIHTDTFQGAGAAAVLGGWLEARGEAVTLRGVAGLRLADPAVFRLALADLARTLADELPGWRRAGWRIVFNLTGGFKAVQGFLQTLGSILADEVVYVFEGGGRLLRVPRLPVRFALDEALEAHVGVFRRLAAGYRLPTEAAAGLPETLVIEIEGEALLSEWGHAAWVAVRDRLLGEALLPPLSAKLVLADRFRRAAKALPAARRAELNHRLDQLSALLDNVAGNPPGLSLKPLAGKPAGPSTHEFHAWSDQDARRGFGHFDSQSGQFVVDRLGEHL